MRIDDLFPSYPSQKWCAWDSAAYVFKWQIGYILSDTQIDLTQYFSLSLYQNSHIQENPGNVEHANAVNKI